MATILLIDDDEQLRGILQQVLSAAGHTVTAAGNGVDGVGLFRAMPTDVVITDVFMPDQDGLGVIMELRRAYPRLGIIAMSGNASRHPNWLTVAGRLGAYRMLAKPFLVAQLTEAIADVLVARAEPVGPA